MRIVFLSVLILLLSGCGIFTTRDPELPVQSRNTWIPATTVDLLIENLKNSLSENSTENYLRCFVDSLLTGKKYLFIPASESFINYSSVFLNWNLQSERVYFENLKSKLKEGGNIILSLFNEYRGTIQGDSINYSADYLLITNHSLEGFPNEFEGSLQFTLYRNVKGEWSILSWKDIKRSNDLTWSELKGRFSY